jgi:uncharacterized repeat protein (TIGR01451 family)
MRAMSTIIRVSRAWRWGAALVLLALAASPAMAQVAAGYSEYFIPGDEDDMRLVLCSYGATACAAGYHTRAVISVTAWSDNTTVYYDHWEDGFNFDPANPGTADETFTMARAGDRLVFEGRNIAIPRDNAAPNPPTSTCDNYRNDALVAAGTTMCYDGRDRLYVAGGVVTVTRVGWIEERGVGLQGVAWEIYPVKPQLTTYVVPFGETSGWYGFQRVATLVQATRDNTVITVDLNHDGSADQLDTNRDGTLDAYSVTLQAGQTFLLDDTSAHVAAGTLAAGAVITGNDTLQVKYLAGRTDVNNCTRGFSAFPRGFWTSDYYAPLDQPGNDVNGQASDTDYYLYNPNSTDITLNWQGQTASGSFTIGANSVVSFRTASGGAPPIGSGLYFSSSGGEVFWGVGSNDANRSGTSTRGYAHEWGYSLLPSTMLYTEHYLGWAPDGLPLAAGQTEMGVFITAAQDNTTLFVDFNGDGSADATYTLGRLQTQYVTDPDGDLSGARFWATGPFSMAYGQNSENSDNSSPALDLGYIAIPGSDFISLVLGVTKSADPQVVPTASGSQTTFAIDVDSQKYSVTGVSVYDLLPANWAYVSGSASITLADRSTLSGAAADPTTLPTYADLFNAISYTNNNSTPAGTVWSTNWIEEGENNGTGTDNIRVMADGAVNAIRFRNSGRALARMANLSLFQGGSLQFLYRRQNTDDAGDRLDVQVCANATANVAPTGITCAAGWVSAPTIVGGVNDGTYQSYTVDLQSLLPGTFDSATFAVRFSTYGSTLAGTDTIWVDDVRIVPSATFVWPGSQLGSMAPNQQIHITFTAQTTAALATGTLSQNRTTAVGTRTIAGVTQTFTASDFAYVVSEGTTGTTVQITKASSVPAATPLYPGDIFTYTTTVTNPAGSGATLTGVTLYDALPAGVSFVAGSVVVTPLASYQDTFASRVYTRQDGLLLWANNWTEAGDDGSATTGGIQVNAGGYLSLQGAAAVRSISRTADLSFAAANSVALSYTAQSTRTGGTDNFLVQYSTDGGASWTTLRTITNTTPSTAYSDPINLTTYPSNLQIRFYLAAANFSAAGESVTVDNVSLSLTPAGPPQLLRNAQLAPGASVVVAFGVIVDSPLPTGISSVTNTASTTSTQLPIAVYASVTNIVTNPSIESASVAGRVWLDSDGNHLQDFGEPGIANVEVVLKDRWGTPVATLFTDIGGRYLFTGVAPGNGYYVEVGSGLPAGVSQSYPDPLTYGNNRSIPFDLAPAENQTGVDLGYRPATGTVIFGDQTWVDANANGVRDAGETALPGVTIHLYRDANGNSLLDGTDPEITPAATSDALGHYLFTVTGAAGNYFVVAATPPGYTLTTPGTYLFSSVVSGSAYLTADFGFTGTTYTITDRVWFDMDASKTVNGTESGIAGVTVDLLDASLNVIATAITAADGTFTFSGVRNGNYTVRISDTSGVLADFTGTTDWAVARQRAETVAGANVSHLAPPSYGFRPTRSLGDTVYYDINGDGVQGAGEAGIPGVSVTLYRDLDADGVIDPGVDDTTTWTTTTDANGHYVFAGLTNGSYIVSLPVPSGYSYTGTGTHADSDSSSPGIQNGATITGGGSVWDLDFGFRATVSRTLAGVVWNDTNGDGVVGTGETGLAGVTLDVRSGTTLVASVTTDASGAYSVQGLAEGSYTVQLTDTNGVLTSLNPTYEKTGGTAGPFDHQETVSLTGGNVTDVNFGYRAPQVTFANVASFRAYLEGGSVHVEWRTSLEVGTVGFHLYRLEPTTRTWTRLDERLLPGLLGHPEGGTYRFVDADMSTEAGTRVSYVVEEVDLRGRRQAHGPYTVRLSEASTPDLAQRAEPRGLAALPAAGMASFASALEARSSGYALAGVGAPSGQALSGNASGWAETLADERAAAAAAQAANDQRSLQSVAYQRQGASMISAVRALSAKSLLQQVAATARKQSRRGGWVEVVTRESGLHHLTAEQIAGPAGLPAATVRGLISSRQLAVTQRGLPVRYLPDAGGAGIYFHAEPVASRYTAENVYQIGLGAGQTMEAIRADGRASLAPSFQETVHREQDVFAATAAILDPNDDFWFWSWAFAGYEGMDTMTAAVPARGVAGAGTASLSVHVVGGTDEAPEIDHHVTVTWNGKPVGESSWGGLGPHAIEIPLTLGDVREGDNTLELQALQDPDVALSVVYLDSIDLSYERQYRAVDDELAFTAPRAAAVQITGFTSADVLVLDVTSPKSPRLVAHTSTLAPDGSLLVRVGAVGGSGTARYLALARQRARVPVEVAASRVPSLGDPANRASYVLIAPDSLVDAAGALAEYRNRRGIATMVVPLTAIYSEFNGGIAEPTAIPAFLRYAMASWRTPPRYVALVGRGTWDYRNVMGVGDNLVPPLLAGSSSGLFVSDVRLADLSGNDGVPELAIGRLPVVTAEELLEYVAKIERQEGAPAADWQRTVLLAADDPDAGGAFTNDSDALAALLPADHPAQKVYLTTTTAVAGRQAIADALGAGVGIFNYIGHGGLDRLADENLWTSSDVASLTNSDRLPAVLTMTCVAGNFGTPGYRSLAEALLLKSDGGAFAVWAPSGLSQNAQAVSLDRSFFSAAFLRKKRVIGDIVKGALAELKGADALPMRSMYNLLGEPVSRLPQ